MPDFRLRPGTKSVTHRMKIPVADIMVFDRIVQTLINANPLGCTPYYARLHHHPPIEKLRERYTARFEYRNERRRQIGSTSEVYDSVEGYGTGIAAVISNMANIASHRAKPRHLPKADLYSVMLQCHDRVDGLYFLNLSRERITLSSFSDDTVLERVVEWTRSIPELA
jgi:hypothetical protein